MKNSIWNAAGALLFLILSVVILLLLTGCGNTIEREKKSQREMENKAIVGSLRKVDFEGHTYVVYREVFGTKNFGGLTHDPECGCEEIADYGCEAIYINPCECGHDTIR